MTRVIRIQIYNLYLRILSDDLYSDYINSNFITYPTREFHKFKDHY